MVAKKKIGLFCAWIFVFLVFVTSDNVTLFIASFILAIGFLFTCARKKSKLKLRWDYYYTIQIIFILYCLAQIIMGIAVLKDVSWSAVRRLVINCIDEVLLFNILIRQDEMESIFDTIIYPFSLGLILITLLQFRSGTLLSFRLSSDLGEDIQQKFLGLTIHAGVSTIVGHCAVCAFVFSLIYYYYSKKRNYVFFSIICLVALALTVSRKAYAVALAMFILIPELRAHNRNRLLRILGSLAVVIIAIVLVMKIPTLYELIGIRFARMFASLTGELIVDYSMNVRSNIKTLAWSAFLKRPIEGWGVNSFKQLFNNGWIYSHNNYLELLVGTGIIGTIIFFSKYIVLFIRGVKLRYKSKGYSDDIVYLSTSFLIWLLMTWVMEYWQVAYYNERMIVHYTVILALFGWFEKKRNILTLEHIKNENRNSNGI